VSLAVGASVHPAAVLRLVPQLLLLCPDRAKCQGLAVRHSILVWCCRDEASGVMKSVVRWIELVLLVVNSGGLLGDINQPITMGGIQARMQCVLPLQCQAEQAAVGGSIPARLSSAGVFSCTTQCVLRVYISALPARDRYRQGPAVWLLVFCSVSHPTRLVPVTLGPVFSRAPIPPLAHLQCVCSCGCWRVVAILVWLCTRKHSCRRWETRALPHTQFCL
jgi:hypothetical protein